MDSIWYIVYIASIALFFPSLILGTIAQSRTVSVFNKYSKIKSICGITASEFTFVLLSKARLSNVKINRVSGKLSDCYDPRSKSVNLSDSTVNSNSLASLGICAHEVGHAIQDDKKMFLFTFRLKLVPVMNFFSKAFFPLMIIGSLLSFSFELPSIGIYVLWTSVIMYGLSFLFYLVTLPLEYDASRRAALMLSDCDFLTKEEVVASKQILNAAIWTYISALVTSMLYFLRFLSYAKLLDRNNR